MEEYKQLNRYHKLLHFSHVPLSLMAVPCREFANIYVPVNQKSCYKPNIYYTNYTTTEWNTLKKGSLSIKPTNIHDRPQYTYSQSSQTLSIDYATHMEVQNGT